MLQRTENKQRRPVLIATKHDMRLGVGEGVLEIVGMLAGVDDDRHFAGDAHELAGAGVRDYGDGLLRDATRECGVVLEDEAAGETVERARDAFDGDVTGRAFDVRAGGEHLAFGGGFEVALELFVDGHAAEHGTFRFIVRRLRDQLHIKRSGCVCLHGCSLLNCGLNQRMRLRLRACVCRECKADGNGCDNSARGATSIVHAGSVSSDVYRATWYHPRDARFRSRKEKSRPTCRQVPPTRGFWGLAGRGPMLATSDP